MGAIHAEATPAGAAARGGKRWKAIARRSAPYTIGIFFVLSLVAGSSGELVRPADLTLPLAVTLVVAAMGHAVGWRLTGSSTKAALIGWIAVVGFGSFGQIPAAWRLAGSIGPSRA